MNVLRSILRGAAPLSGLEALTLLLSLLMLPYLMRALGPTEFGRYAFGVSAGGALTMLVDYGFNQLGPKEVARAAATGGERAAIYWGVQLAKLQIALVAIPAALAAAWALGLLENYASVLAPAVVGALASLVYPAWYILGLQRYRTLALSLSSARLVSALATVALVHTPQHAVLAVWLQAAVAPLAGLLALSDAALRREMHYRRPNLPVSWGWLRSGGPLFGSTAAISMYTTCVPLVLGALTTPTVVGLFSAADKARIAGQTLLSPLTAAAFPMLSRLIIHNRAGGLAAARQVMLIQVGVALIGTVGILLLAEPAIRFVVGVQFLPAVPAARILSLCLIFTALTNALGVQVMLPLNMDRPFAVILGVCASLGLLATWLLAPLWFEKGAAVAVLGTEVMIVVLVAVYLRCRGVSVWKAQQHV